MAYKTSLDKVLGIIKEGDKVLDIGGWGGTLNRATHVMDINPYKTRNKIHQIGEKEHYSEETWVERDICDREPFPYPDKFFDFVFCSHTLEDIRDPIWVCSEMKRIAKRGYIEFPSPKYELSRGVEGFEGRGFVGNAHHRWVIFVEKNKVQFLQKHHFLNGRRRFSIPYAYYKKMRAEDKVSFMIFGEDFKFEELNIWNESILKDHFEKIIKEFNCRSDLFWKFDKMQKKMVKMAVKVKRILNELVRDINHG